MEAWLQGFKIPVIRLHWAYFEYFMFSCCYTDLEHVENHGVYSCLGALLHVFDITSWNLHLLCVGILPSSHSRSLDLVATIDYIYIMFLMNSVHFCYYPWTFVPSKVWKLMVTDFAIHLPRRMCFVGNSIHLLGPFVSSRWSFWNINIYQVK